MKSFFLSIAGFNIHIESACTSEIMIDEGHKPFITNERDHADLHICAFNSIPPYLKETNNCLFQAKNNGQDFFSIYQQKDELTFIIYSQEKLNTIQQIALLNNNLTEWKVYSNADENNTMTPLSYPFGPLMLYYLTVKYNAIMIHASGIFDGEKGRIFSGFSGSGKSTMAGLWQKEGSIIINDDRLIIKKTPQGYTLYNTPMFYSDIPREAPLNSISIIHHSPENKILKLSGAQAVSSIMAHCIQHCYSPIFLEHHLDFLTGLCKKTSVNSIGFKPDNEIIELIKEHAD